MKKLILILFLITSQIWATDYYFSSSTGSDAGAGTQASPYATMQKLSSLSLTGGDNVYLLRGDTWKPPSIVGRNGILEITNKNGSAGNYITITAYGSEADPLPEISAANISYSYESVRLKGSCSYIHFDNIKFDGKFMWNMDKTEFGTTNGMHHIKITNFEQVNGRFYMDNYMPGISYVPNSNDPYCNPFYKIEIGDGVMTEGTGEDMINFIFGIRYIDENGLPTTFANRGKIDWTNETMPDTNIWLHDLTMLNGALNGEMIDLPGGNLHLVERIKASGSRGGGNIIKSHSEYSQITDCIFRDIETSGSWWDYPYAGPFPNSSAFGLGFKNLKDCIIESNTCSGRYPAAFGDGTGTGVNTLYGTFEGNIIRNNNFYGAVNIVGSGGTYSTGWTHPQQDSIGFLNTWEGNNFWINSQWTEGSRLIKAADPYLDSKSVATDAYGGSSYWGKFTPIWLTYYGNDDTHVEPQMADPVFVTPYDRGDYTLATGSPLIDSGYPTGVDHIYDINKNLRTQGVIDVGAYETSGGAISPRFTVSAYSGGTYTSPTFNYGTVQPSETKTGYIDLTNVSPDSTITLTSATLGGAFDSLFTIVDTYGVIASIATPVTLPYVVPVSGVVRLEVDFDGSTVESTKSATLSLVHTSTAQTSPIVINLSVTVSDGSVVFAISGDSTKTFTTSKGSEALTNYGFTNWTSDDPDGWTILGEDGSAPTDDQVTQSSAGVARILTAGDYVAMKQYSILSVGEIYVYETDIDAVTDGSVKLENSTEIINTWSGSDVGINYGWFTAVATQIAIARGSSSGNTNVDLNYFSLKPITTSSWNATATVTNSGSGTLTCTSIALVDGTNFTYTGSSTFSLGAAATSDLTYSFTPADTGRFYDTLRISGINASVTSYDIPIVGYFQSGYTPASSPRINFEFGDIYFPDTDTSATYDTTFNLWNDGGSTLTISSITVPSHYSLLFPNGSGDTTLAAGDTLDVTVRFIPTTTGVKSGNIAIAHNGDNLSTPFNIPISGTATAISTPAYFTFINPTSGTLDFGSVTIGTEASTNRNVIWQNDGSTTLAGIIDLIDSTLYTHLSGTFTLSTAQDTRDTLSFKFEPTTAGTFTDTLKFYDNATNLDSPHVVIFTGIGLPSDQNFAINDTYHYFGVKDTSDADTVTFTITNSGGAALSGTISMDDSEQFTLLNGGAYSTLATKTFSVIAQPTDEMYYEIDVTITHNATNTTSPQTVTLAVTGDVPSKLALIPTNYHFGSVYLGNSKTSSNLIAYNKGRDTITVDSIYLATNSVFKIPDTLGATLPGNLIINGGADKDTLWTYSSGAAIANNKFTFSNASTYSTIIQSLTYLKRSTAYLIIFDVSDHAGTGDDITIGLGGESTLLGASSYTNGTVAVQMFSGDSDSGIGISLSYGTRATKLDNIKLMEYAATQVTFTPVEGTVLNTDILYYEHNVSGQTNPYPLNLTGYKTTGNFTIPFNIRHED